MGAKSENASHQINTKNICLQELDKEFKRLNKYNFEDYFILFLLFTCISLPVLEEEVLAF